MRRILHVMTLRVRYSASILLAAALFPLAASMSLACCMGIAAGAHASLGAPSHCGDDPGGGQSCHQRAADDAAARHCCEGGDAFERPRAGGEQLALAVTAVRSPRASTADAPMREGALSASDPVPRTEPLYTLHSSLLI